MLYLHDELAPLEIVVLAHHYDYFTRSLLVRRQTHKETAVSVN